MAWGDNDDSDDSSLFSRVSETIEEVGVGQSVGNVTSPQGENSLPDTFDRERTRHHSFAEYQEESTDESPQSPSNNGPAEQERQILLLMLLAQVCALHDPTPRTFTVHVLELFERGILDRQSILFLFELGLVPSTTTSKLILPDTASEDFADPEKGRQLSVVHQKTSIPLKSAPYRQRTAEASAIRNSLEQQERQRNYKKSQSEPLPSSRQTSWSAKHHPLSLSRYQREFEQIRMLSSGAFGQVFEAVNKMDGTHYAVKKIEFKANGYSKDSVQQVVREVHCLATCDHPNVVRYFTSWLEPTWMTGSGSSGVVDTEQHQKLLQDINHIVSGTSEEDEESHEASNRLKSYFGENSSSIRKPKRRFSFDASESEWDNDQSEWTIDERVESLSKYDRFDEDIFERSTEDCLALEVQHSVHPSFRRKASKPQGRQNYQYQICLFIQMQLCHPSSLADWIRERNNSQIYGTIDSRLSTVQVIFRQICLGLSHVHKRDIIHRDLKPANIFVSLDAVEGELQFKIGDFGLSRHLGRSKAKGNSSRSPKEMAPLLLSCSEEIEETFADNRPLDGGLKDPLTAGIGTASYASPEQVSSKRYSNKADIFSLGLILLELVCSFSTEHERYQVFNDCRHKRRLPKDVLEYPTLAKVILHCTDPVPHSRPKAEDIAQLDFQLMEANAVSLTELSRQGCVTETENLRKLLTEKEQKLVRLEEKLMEKDRLIAELKAENERLRRVNEKEIFTYPPPKPEFCVGGDDSSSEEGI